MKHKLTIDYLIEEAEFFCLSESRTNILDLYGVTDGKAVGTYIEHRFKNQLLQRYEVEIGSSASGIDLPSIDIQTDIKVTSVKQPQSSCPFKDVRQKIYGLGYNLLVFVYDKTDDVVTRSSILNFVSCTFISKERTADYSTTYRLRELVNDMANETDVIAYLSDRNLPADEIILSQLAHDIILSPPNQGYLTISNALQWRLQYQRILELQHEVEGITKIIRKIKG